MWDDGDEALQPEWEIDPKDLQILEKVHQSHAVWLVSIKACALSNVRLRGAFYEDCKKKLRHVCS